MKTMLIEYQGGGYDGCFWEWNYAIIHNAKFYNVHSSGHNGCESVNDLKIRLKESKFYTYNVNDPKQWDDFQKNSNAQNVLGVAQWIEKYSHLNETASLESVYLDCPVCGDNIDPDSIVLHPQDYQGNGGIGIQYNSFICAECLSNQSCAYCGEWVGAEDSEDWQPYNPEDEIESNYGPMDKYCYESLAKNNQ